MTTATGFAGERLFARYAYAPNDLGYCGPAQSRILLECGAGGGDPARVREVARAFTGAWPMPTHGPHTGSSIRAPAANRSP